MTDLKEFSLEQFKEKVLFQRILEWNEKRLVLENGLAVDDVFTPIVKS